MTNCQNIYLIKSMSERDFKRVAASGRAEPRGLTQTPNRNRYLSQSHCHFRGESSLHCHCSRQVHRFPSPAPQHHCGLDERCCLPPGEPVELRDRDLQLGPTGRDGIDIFIASLVLVWVYNINITIKQQMLLLSIIFNIIRWIPIQIHNLFHSSSSPAPSNSYYPDTTTGYRRNNDIHCVYLN